MKKSWEIVLMLMYMIKNWIFSIIFSSNTIGNFPIDFEGRNKINIFAWENLYQIIAYPFYIMLYCTVTSLNYKFPSLSADL